MNKLELLRTARQRMQDCIDADEENRDEALDDLEQLVGQGQWPDDIRASRESDNRPCLTINRLPQFVRQVTGDIRRMNPSIKVMPGDQEASQESAEIVEGLVRHIQSESDASSVYEWAAECAAGCGIGWFRINTEWCDDSSFLQKIRLQSVRNPLTVYFDPLSEMPTREDSEYIFITSNMQRTDFETAYPDAQPIDADRDAQIEGISNWYGQDTVVVSEYFWKETTQVTLSLLEDGSTVEKAPAPLRIVRQRKAETTKIMWAKISGSDVLEGPRELPGKHIPLICVPGEEWQIGDRTHRAGVIRYAKDPQRLYNYWRSAQTELVALQPKAPFLVTTKEVEGLESLWQAANESNRAYLPYNPDPKAPGRPQRATPPIASQGMMAEVQMAAEDMKGTTGVYDAALGNRSNETSGVAIRQRQMEADVGTSIYSDNMAKAVEYAGRIIVDLIPKIYDTRRVVAILGANDEEKLVAINDVLVTQDGIVGQNNITQGQYAVKISVGPNYSTMRQEAAENMIEFVRAFPAAAQVTGDLIAKNMDWPQADEFAERLKKLLPPGIAEEEDGEQDPQVVMLQQQLQQAMQAMEQMQQDPAYRKAQAEANEAESDAEKARFETIDKQLETMAQTGQLDAAIGQLVQQEVARALQSVIAPQF